VQERLDGSMHLVFKERYLAFKPIAHRPHKAAYVASRAPTMPVAPRPVAKPIPSVHPWRRGIIRPYQPALPGPCHSATFAVQ
jgi:hypothetical protein